MTDLQPPAVPSPAAPVRIEFGAGWERRVVEKIWELRRSGKRAMLFVDGARIFVYSAEPRGTIALD